MYMLNILTIFCQMIKFNLKYINGNKYFLLDQFNVVKLYLILLINYGIRFYLN